MKVNKVYGIKYWVSYRDSKYGDALLHEGWNTYSEVLEFIKDLKLNEDVTIVDVTEVREVSIKDTLFSV